MTPLAPNKAPSAASAVGPYRPSRPVNRPNIQQQRTAAWVNSDSRIPIRTEKQVLAQAVRVPVRPVKAAPKPAPKKPSAWKRAGVGLAVFGGIAGIIGGLVSIVALGPVGLAIAGGSFLVAMGAILSLRKYG